MGQYEKLWSLLFAMLVVCFTIPGYMGSEVYKRAPPYPEKTVSSSGRVLMTKDGVLIGQSAWQTTGGMEIGSVSGHGAYQAPGWAADWLYRKLITWLGLTARKDCGKKFDELTEERKAVLKTRAAEEYRSQNRIQADGSIVLSDTRVKAVKEIVPYYMGAYGDDLKFQSTCEHFAMKNNTLSSAEACQKLFNFSSWTSWSISTNHPDENFTHTNNWSHEPLIKNVPTTENYTWSFASVALLLVGIGSLMWGYSFPTRHGEVQVPTEDPTPKVQSAPS